MVRWYHAIFTAYGFRLPNEPRGSWSNIVASWELYKLGGPTTEVRHSVAHSAHNVEMRKKAKTSSKYPPVRFDKEQRELIAAGIAQAVAESNIQIHACAIGYDHVHAIVARHEKCIEDVVHHFKSRATKHLKREGVHPLAEFADAKGAAPTPWAEGSWRVYINDAPQLGAAVGYVNRHPQKEGLPPQQWSFISPV